MKLYELIIWLFIAAPVMTVIVMSYARPSPLRTKVMILGPPTFVMVGAALMPSFLAYERTQTFPDYLAYGLAISAAMEFVLFLFMKNGFTGEFGSFLIKQNEGHVTEELEEDYTRISDKFSKLPLIASLIFGSMAVIAFIVSLFV